MLNNNSIADIKDADLSCKALVAGADISTHEANGHVENHENHSQPSPAKTILPAVQRRGHIGIDVNGAARLHGTSSVSAPVGDSTTAQVISPRVRRFSNHQILPAVVELQSEPSTGMHSPSHDIMVDNIDGIKAFEIVA